MANYKEYENEEGASVTVVYSDYRVSLVVSDASGVGFVEDADLSKASYIESKAAVIATMAGATLKGE